MKVNTKNTKKMTALEGDVFAYHPSSETVQKWIDGIRDNDEGGD